MKIRLKSWFGVARSSFSLALVPLATFCLSSCYASSATYCNVVTRSHLTMEMHTKARGPEYPGTAIQKSPVPDEYVKWDVPYDGYKPVDYTSDSVLLKPIWADPDLSEKSPDPPFQYNNKDNHYNVDRTSFTPGKYKIIGGKPRNPCGRTGMTGRGLLGRWGPNHAADPVVTRWKTDSNGQRVQENGEPVLQFVAIKRKDNGQWAIPGGMVDPGDTVSRTLKKEFGEEAMNSLELTESEQKKIQNMLTQLFQNGNTLWQGYVDDPRNTDNAWMETVAVNYHDETGEVFSKFDLKAGDDAGEVRWLAIRHDLELYASHKDIVERAARFHFASWGLPQNKCHDDSPM